MFGIRRRRISAQQHQAAANIILTIASLAIGVLNGPGREDLVEKVGIAMEILGITETEIKQWSQETASVIRQITFSSLLQEEAKVKTGGYL